MTNLAGCILRLFAAIVSYSTLVELILSDDIIKYNVSFYRRCPINDYIFGFSRSISNNVSKVIVPSGLTILKWMLMSITVDPFNDFLSFVYMPPSSRAGRPW